MLTVKADNVTISNPDAATALDRMSAALERMSVVVNVPQQDAPVVNVEAPVVNVKVEPTPVTIKNDVKIPEIKSDKSAPVIKQDGPKRAKAKQKVIKDNDGTITGTETVTDYEY